METDEEKKWQNLKKTITKELNFDTENYTNNFIKRRVACRMRAIKIDDYFAYSLALQKDKEEQKKLLKELTIHVTNFFRDREMWNTLETKILIPLIDAKIDANDKNLSFWCAGASYGDEPYSLAILLSEILSKKNKLSNFHIRITAEDIESKVIEKAKKGEFVDTHFSEMDVSLLEKYFDNINSSFVIKEDIKKLIYFRTRDILSPFGAPKNIDVLFCRNTVIYFEREIKENLYTKFSEILKPKGYFVMGKMETLSGPARDDFNCIDTSNKFFRKKS
ncbi:MAG: protein-glutamate O-methyltransferase CheR [Candidatus Aenigmarchaeota archaeon]|nr:protein-glutamate O-methyltransferase CheR [Candidatus Aenigmarchaeota archaeon]